MRLTKHQFCLKLEDSKRNLYNWFLAHSVIIDGKRNKLYDHNKFSIKHTLGYTTISHFGCPFPNPAAVIRYLQDYIKSGIEENDTFVFTYNTEIRDNDGITYTNSRWIISPKGSREQNNGQWVRETIASLINDKSELAQELYEIIIETDSDFQDQAQDHLDELVSQSYSIEASSINNEGMLNQIKYLLENDMQGSIQALINTLEDFEKDK